MKTGLSCHMTVCHSAVFTLEIDYPVYHLGLLLT